MVTKKDHENLFCKESMFLLQFSLAFKIIFEKYIKKKKLKKIYFS